MPGQYSERSLHSVNDLEEINLKVTSMSPQNDPGELLEQLELFERLHYLYEKKQIKKCLLSAYIYISRQYRMDILSYMGSPMADTWSREQRPLPIVWQRLAKIPGSISLLNDKGFAGTERYYPNLNRIKTPPVMRARKVKQYHQSELKPKADLCRLRYTCEVVFARVTEQDLLKDKIPYCNLKSLTYGIEWAHAHSNLHRPLKPPGSKSGLPDDYWD